MCPAAEAVVLNTENSARGAKGVMLTPLRVSTTRVLVMGVFEGVLDYVLPVRCRCMCPAALTATVTGFVSLAARSFCVSAGIGCTSYLKQHHLQQV
jgi:hypothetical protein